MDSATAMHRNDAEWRAEPCTGGRRRPPVPAAGAGHQRCLPPHGKSYFHSHCPPSNKLDELAQLQHRKLSELIHEPVEEYSREHSG
ncbi:hypothetical protein [Rhodococcus sp. IEGM 1307]|uniref:hypothetical protein n=1 Tax=Rhodococcus sp. IEGM 1307 TaxID=3047091 RepID=UPI0024B7D26D|nr:hypothetical protein [Rhodococcus sp. IEGM 1307]MDI9978826.1 hypothetical protein [Rhodococcus sp. IEGM 1307]